MEITLEKLNEEEYVIHLGSDDSTYTSNPGGLEEAQDLCIRLSAAFDTEWHWS